MRFPKSSELGEYFLMGVVIALLAYGVALAGLDFAAFFVVPAIAAPVVIAFLRRRRGQEQEVGALVPYRG